MSFRAKLAAASRCLASELRQYFPSAIAFKGLRNVAMISLTTEPPEYTTVMVISDRVVGGPYYVYTFNHSSGCIIEFLDELNPTGDTTYVTMTEVVRAIKGIEEKCYYK